MRELVIPTFVSMKHPLREGMQILADAGVRLIEVHGDAPDLHIDLLDDGVTDRIDEAIEGTPIRVHSVHCAFTQPSEECWDISNPDANARSAAIHNWKTVIRVGARLNARHVTFHSGTPLKSPKRTRNCLACLLEITETARELGVMIAFENLPPHYMGGSVEEISEVLDAADPAVAGFCLDTGHAMIGRNSIEDYIRAFGSRMIAIHWHSGLEGSDAHVFPSLAEADWRGFFMELNRVRYDLPIIVESAPPDELPLADAVRAVEDMLAESYLIR